MGYRSDVRIVTSKRGYNELKKSIQDYYKENDIPKDYQFDLLNNTNVMEINKYQVYLGWNNIKWYGYPDVDAIEDGDLNKTDAEGIWRKLRAIEKEAKDLVNRTSAAIRRLKKAKARDYEDLADDITALKDETVKLDGKTYHLYSETIKAIRSSKERR